MVAEFLPVIFIVYVVLSNHYMIFARGEVANFIANDINILRDKGKSCLTSKNFGRASKYYSAILQLIEKDKNEKSDSLRRRCALTLAECEIQSGNWHQAIARCSEIIDECIDINIDFNENNDTIDTTTVKDMREALGKAFYRRGVSFFNLNKTSLAYLDFNLSMEYLPENKNVHNKISSIKKIFDVNNEEMKFENTEEELRDLVEECQYNYPRINFSIQQISKLIAKDAINSRKKLELENNINDEMNPFENMSNLFGGLGNSGNLGSGLGLGGGLSSIPLLLTTFAGVDPKKAKQIGDIIEAVTSVFNKFQSGYKLIVKNQNIIIVILTIIWIAVSFFLPLVSKFK